MTDQQTPKGVVALVQSTVEKRKDRILLAATELFVACDIPDPGESHVFAELFRAYIDATPLEERRRIASLLARYPHAPHDTVLRLMRDDDASVAHRIIAYSPVLTHCDLVTAIGRGPEELRRAVVLRENLPDDVITALMLHAATETLDNLETVDPEPATLEASNLASISPEEPDRKLTALLADILADDLTASEREIELKAEPKTNITPDMAAEPAQHADTEENVDMQKDNANLGTGLNAPQTTSVPSQPAGDLTFLHADMNERAQVIAAAQGRIMAEMAASSTSSTRRGFNTDHEMLRCLEQSAMARDKESFLGVLASMLDIDEDTAERITLDAGGEPLIVALASLGMATSRAVSVMIQMSPAVNDVVRLRELSALRANLDPRTALAIVNQWRRTPIADQANAQHQPLLDAAERLPRTANTSTEQPAEKRDRADVLVLRDVAN